MPTIRELIEAYQASMARVEAEGRKPRRTQPSKHANMRAACDVCGNEVYERVLVDTEDGTRACRACHRRAEHVAEVKRTDGYKLAVKWYGRDETMILTLAEAINDALAEGRVDPEMVTHLGIEQGQYTCRVCGLRTWTQRDADACCYGVVPNDGCVDLSAISRDLEGADDVRRREAG